MYKTKETALRHLRNGENFWRKDFQLYWRDPDVYSEALAINTGFFEFFAQLNPTVAWSEKFMREYFNSVIQKGVSYSDMASIGPFLPPDITDSKDFGLLVGKSRVYGYSRFISPDLSLNEEVCKALSIRPPQYCDDWSADIYQCAMQFPDVLPKLIHSNPEVYKSLPQRVQHSRPIALAYCIEKQSLWYAYNGLHDDEAFVLDVLKDCKHPAMRSSIFKWASYRIRKLVGDNDPVVFLEKHIEMTKLTADLNKGGAAKARNFKV